MLKLFSRVLLARIADQLNRGRSVDQAGFRHSCGCDDHLFTLTMLHEECNEWGLPLWIAATDFRKAFDTVEHDAIWAALSEYGIPSSYIAILRRLYDGQAWAVVGNRQSRQFQITRGTKQGDLISPPLFNAVLDKAMSKAKANGRRRVGAFSWALTKMNAY